jgi:heterodisulfide reductase subunit A-like polyferredoxin
VPSGSQFCPGCGIPQQIFEVVSAGISAPMSADGTGGAMRALVRADMCVGCATCVAACPEDGALTMRGKLAVVDNALCKGHGDCVAACPVGAISVNAGSAANRVQVPLIDVNFETNVPGVYIVGELGGRGLIKNAINEGKIAAEHVASRPRRAAQRRRRHHRGRRDRRSGPAGLSAGSEAHRRHLRYVVLEQGTLADRCASTRVTSCRWRAGLDPCMSL